MQERNLRVLKWRGTIPAIAVCTSCNLEFKVPMKAMKRVGDAQEYLRAQFVEHTCKDEDATAAPLKNLREIENCRAVTFRASCP
jgi:hypothetical protein